MAPIINVSDKTLAHLKGLGVKYDLIEQPRAQPTALRYEVNPSDYIILDARDAGKDSYPDLWVCKYRLGVSHRLGVSPDVAAIGKNVGLTLENTAKEQNKRMYIGNITREQAVRLNLALSGRTLNLTLFHDFAKLLDSGRAFDGNGKKARKSELSQILGEIFEVREPWRAELFEDYFSRTPGELVLNKNYRLDKDGVLKPNYSEPVQECLMENRTPGISFEDWIKHATYQGLPLKNIGNGSLHSLAPRAGYVAWFVAYSVRAYLSCYGHPDGSDPLLGVRHVREALKK